MRLRFFFVWCAFGLVLFSLPAFAQSASTLKHLTIYDAGVAEFLEERALELQPGFNTIEWRSLMPKAFTGTIRVTADNAEVVRQDLTYDGTQVGQEKSPVLHLVLNNKGAAGTRRVQVDYLAPGLRWQANYSMLLESTSRDLPPKSATMDVWVTLFNDTGTDVSAATVDLIAGEISLLEGDNEMRRNDFAMQMNVRNEMADSAAGSVNAEVGGLSVFSRIRLGNNITMKANALINRLPLFQRATLAITQRNVFENEYSQQTLARGGFILQPRGLQTRFVATNKTGITMPGGKVTIYSRDNELAQVSGQDRIMITANGGDFAVSPGRSSTLVGTRRVVSRKSVDCRDEEKCHGSSKLVTSVEVVITNRGAVEAEAFLREGIEVGDGSEWKITQSSSPNERLSDHSLQFKVSVPSGGSTKVTYTVETK
jgi:hypothetical protein